MKKLLIITIFIGFVIEVNSQSRHLGITNSGLFIGQTLRVLSEPMIEFRNGKKGWKFGPSIILHGENEASDKNFPKLSGINATFVYYPLPSLSKINFYLFSTVRLLLISNKWESKIWDSNFGLYKAYKYKSDEFLITQNLGYGLIFNIKNHLSLRQGVGLGAYYSSTNNKGQSPGAPEIGDMNLSGYNNLGFSWIISFDINYSF